MPPRTEVRRYYSNRSRWPFEQVGILLAARKEFAEQGGGVTTRWEVLFGFRSAHLWFDWQFRRFQDVFAIWTSPTHTVSLGSLRC